MPIYLTQGHRASGGRPESIVSHTSSTLGTPSSAHSSSAGPQLGLASGASSSTNASILSSQPGLENIMEVPPQECSSGHSTGGDREGTVTQLCKQFESRVRSMSGASDHRVGVCI